MANTIKLKTGSGSDPSASDLVLGELAIRTDNGKIFLKKGGACKTYSEKIKIDRLKNLKFNNPAAFAELPKNLRDLYEETEDPANEFMSYKDFPKFSFDDFENNGNLSDATLIRLFGDDGADEETKRIYFIWEDGENGENVDISKQEYIDRLIGAVEANPEVKNLADKINENFIS